MNLIKLDATESTNQFLKDLALTESLTDFTVVSCDNQIKGRGQRGTNWETEPGKNLTFSILKNFNHLQAADQFKINIAISLAVLKVVANKGLLKIFVKWPNDIMADDQKLCGILIENILQGTSITKSIIGIGLNVNQENFGGLERATSMKLQSGKDFDLENLLLELVAQVQIELKTIQNQNLFERYEGVLYKRDMPATFVDNDNESFMGIIQGVEPDGILEIKTEAGTLRRFRFKEVKMVY